MAKRLGARQTYLTSKQPSNSRPRGSTEELLGPVALAVSALGVILGAIDSLLKIIDLVEMQFYLTTSILWVASLVLARRYTPKLLSFKAISPQRVAQTILTIVYVIGITWTYYEHYYEHHLKKTFHADLPTIILANFVGVSEVYSATLPTTVRLISFYMNEDLSSFQESNEALFGAGKTYKTYTPSKDVYAAFQQGRCSGLAGDKSQRDVLPIIRRLVQERNTPQLLPYLTEKDSLGRLARERGDISQQVMFTSTDLEKLRDVAPADYKIAKAYILDCIGIYQPVFTVTLNNPGKSGIDIVEVIYVVEQVGQVLGAEPGGPVYPEYTYDHVLVHTPGNQPWDLHPVFNLPPGSTRSFNIRLSTDDHEIGMGWLLRVKFLDSRGGTVETPTFQLYLNREGSIK